jgi:hypothetical protein
MLFSEHALRRSFQMSHAIFTRAVVTSIRYTICWHLVLCCVVSDQKNHSYSKRELAGFCKWLTNLYHRAVSGPRLRYWWRPVSTYIPRFWINNTDSTLFIPFRCRTTLLFSFLSSFFLNLFRFDQSFKGSVKLEYNNRQHEIQILVCNMTESRKELYPLICCGLVTRDSNWRSWVKYSVYTCWNSHRQIQAFCNVSFSDKFNSKRICFIQIQLDVQYSFFLQSF